MKDARVALFAMIAMALSGAHKVDVSDNRSCPFRVTAQYCLRMMVEFSSIPMIGGIAPSTKFN